MDLARELIKNRSVGVCTNYKRVLYKIVCGGVQSLCDTQQKWHERKLKKKNKNKKSLHKKCRRCAYWAQLYCCLYIVPEFRAGKKKIMKHERKITSCPKSFSLTWQSIDGCRIRKTHRHTLYTTVPPKPRCCRQHKLMCQKKISLAEHVHVVHTAIHCTAAWCRTKEADNDDDENLQLGICPPKWPSFQT